MNGICYIVSYLRVVNGQDTFSVQMGDSIYRSFYLAALALFYSSFIENAVFYGPTDGTIT